jgi:hypothetical protein
MKKNAIIAVLIILALVVGLITEGVFYDNLVADKNSKIANLNDEISKLTSQIFSLQGQVANLNGQVANLTSAKLVTAIGISEVNTPSGIKFNKLFIEGSVNNTGQGTAFHAGLNVVAYSANGTLLVNMTVPLGFMALFGTDSATSDYAQDFYSSTRTLALGNLLTTQTASINIGIFHRGTASNWTVSPVWTNSP